MVGYNDNVGVGELASLVQPREQPPELPVGLADGGCCFRRADSVGVLRGVGFGEPEQRDGGLPPGQNVFSEDVYGVGHLGRGRPPAVGPRAESVGYLGVQRAGQAEVGVNGCAAACLRVGVLCVGVLCVGVLCVGILQVGVAGGAGAHGNVFLSMPVENVSQGGFQQHRMPGGDFRECRLQCADGVMRIEFRDDQHIRRQPVSAGMVASDDAGDVGASDGGKDRVVIVASDAPGGKTG